MTDIREIRDLQKVALYGSNDGGLTWEPIEAFSGGGGVTDHGALTGLEDDDHTQYLLVTEVGTVVQAWDAALDDLALGWLSAGVVNPSSLDFEERTANGTNLGRLRGPDAIASDRIWQLPDAGGEVVIDTATQTLSDKTLTAPTVTDFTNANHDHGDADSGGAIVAIQGHPVAATAPTLGHAHVWDGDSFVPASVPRKVHGNTAVVCPDNTTENSMWSSTFTIPANTPAVGDKLEYLTGFNAVNTVGGAHGLTWRAKLDGTAVATVGAGATGLANNYVGGGIWHLVIIFTAVGGSGQVFVILETWYNNTLAVSELHDLRAGAFTTVDTTQDLTLDVTAQKTSANAAYDVTLQPGSLMWTPA